VPTRSAVVPVASLGTGTGLRNTDSATDATSDQHEGFVRDEKDPDLIIRGARSGPAPIPICRSRAASFCVDHRPNEAGAVRALCARGAARRLPGGWAVHGRGLPDV
jgi:hypothetical protein